MLIVAGQFDDNGGKPSGYAQKLFGPPITDALPRCAKFINGGNYKQLEELDVTPFKIIIWMADVPNDKPKLIQAIKAKNPHCILVSSKNNLAGKYQPLDLISRALDTRSSLLLEFTDSDGLTECSLWDPLGNVYVKSSTIPEVRTALFDRIFELLMTERVASLCKFPSIGIPNEKEFFKIASDYAEKLHDLTHAVNQSRFVGNLSFRCQNGFPSFRGSDKVIYVSKRNIDKREINKESFVPVALYANDPVEYYGQPGDHKPSVDTPIQVRLYQTFPKIQYMIHTHAYIKDALLTPHILPCGDVREAEAVRRLVDHPHERNVEFFVVNLRGHGSLVAAHELQYLRDIQYEARPLPEMVV